MVSYTRTVGDLQGAIVHRCGCILVIYYIASSQTQVRTIAKLARLEQAIVLQVLYIKWLDPFQHHLLLQGTRELGSA